MQPFVRFLNFIFRIVFGAFAVDLLLRRVPHVNQWWPKSGLGLLFSSVLMFVIVALYDRVIYHRFRSPLRHLPTIKGSNRRQAGSTLGLITETPRGKTPLQWMREHPDADMVHIIDEFGGSTLFPASPIALRDVMSTNTYDFEKPWPLRAFLARVIGFGLILSENESHKRQRRALTPAFNIKHIRALYEPMWESVQLFVDTMAAEAKSGDIEIGEWSSRLALDIIGRAALSCDFESLTSSNNRIAQAFFSILEPEPHMVVFLGLNLLIPPAIMQFLPLKANRVITRECKYLRGVCEKILDDKQSQKLTSEKKEEEDFSILQRVIASGEFSRDELVDQMLTFLAAGHETTGSSITWATHLLTMPEFQHYQQTLRNEIKAFQPQIQESIKSNDRSLHKVFESMPYLNGVCEEVLRLFPAVPATVRESIRQTTIAGVTVPKDTRIVLVPWAVNRNPRFWGTNADKLYPERWIDKLPDGTLRPNKHGGTDSNYSEITFLHGQRACIGRDFAKVELRCALAGIFGRFEVERLEGYGIDVEITGAVTTKPRGGLRLRLIDMYA